MSLATLNGAPISRGRVQVPAWGLWWSDLDLQDPEEFSSGDAANLQFADVAAVGTIISGGVVHGRARYRIVGGSGGWSKPIAARGYTNDLGVRKDKVLTDAANDAGESIDSPPTDSLGPHFARTAGLASRVLNDVTPRGWRVDFDGVTRFGLRPTTTYQGEGTRSRIDPNVQVIDVVTDEIATLVPGVVIDGSNPATDVEYVLDEGRLTARVYAGQTQRSRSVDALASIIEALFPSLRYRGLFEYRLVIQVGERMFLQPVRAATGLPDLSNVPVRPGMAGVKCDGLLGALVLVAFIDADPSRPCVVSWDAPDAPGYHPLFLDLGEEPVLGVARVTDTVVAGPYGGAVTGSSTRIRAGL